MISLLFFFLQFSFPTYPLFSLGLYYQTQRQTLCPYTTILLTSVLCHWFSSPFNILIIRSCFAGYLFYEQALFELLRQKEQIFRLMCIWNSQQILEGFTSHQTLESSINQIFFSNVVLLIGLFSLAFLKSQRPAMVERMF